MNALLAALTALMLAGSPDAASMSGLVVHEWGTFTSFQSSDGVQLDFRPLEFDDLPDFVFDRAEHAGFAALGDGKGVVCRHRMETPVTYFYTDAPRTVDVWVSFPDGLLTEFYPPPHQMQPPYNPDAPEPLSNSSLHWCQLQILPASGSPEELGFRQLPPAGDNNHYRFARETDSAIVSASGATTHAEKFLFYRGVGNFTLPVKLEARGADRFAVSNSGAEPLAAAFLVENADGRLRFAFAPRIERTHEFTLPADATTTDQLCDRLAAALTTTGLFEKEARAMVNTWRDAWLDEPGTRLLYVLPQSLTDRIIPLRIEPAPDTVTRVLVGRMEILTPEREAAIGRAIRELRSDSPAKRDAARAQLASLGRFAEPALNRYCTQTVDPRAIADLLNQLWAKDRPAQ